MEIKANKPKLVSIPCRGWSWEHSSLLCPEAIDSEYLRYYANTEALEFILTRKSGILMEGNDVQVAERGYKNKFTYRLFLLLLSN